MNAKHHPNNGSRFDAMLAEEGILEEVNTAAIKQVIALQIMDAMKEAKLTKSELAKRMHTSRAAVDRLFNTDNDSLTLATLGKAAQALGRQLKVELAP